MTRTRKANLPSGPCSQRLMIENQERFTEICSSKFKLSARASSTRQMPISFVSKCHVTAAKFRFAERSRAFIMRLSRKMEGYSEILINASQAFHSTESIPASFQCHVTSAPLTMLPLTSPTELCFRMLHAVPRRPQNQNKQDAIGQYRNSRPRWSFTPPFHLMGPCRDLQSS